MKKIIIALAISLTFVASCFLYIPTIASAHTTISNTDNRLSQATSWASQQVGSYSWGSGTNTYCERFVENAYNVSGKASNPLDLFKRFGGVHASPAVPGLIIVFAGNSSNGNNGHAAIYMGGDSMISVTTTGVRKSSVSAWSHSVAPMIGYVYPPSSWPGR